MSRKKTGQGREKGLDTTHLITGHNVPEADAAERDETEVAAVQQAPLLPPAEQRGPEQNVPATKGNRVKAFRCLPFIGHRHLTGQQTDRQTDIRTMHWQWTHSASDLAYDDDDHRNGCNQINGKINSLHLSRDLLHTRLVSYNTFSCWSVGSYAECSGWTEGTTYTPAARDQEGYMGERRGGGVESRSMDYRSILI